MITISPESIQYFAKQYVLGDGVRRPQHDGPPYFQLGKDFYVKRDSFFNEGPITFMSSDITRDNEIKIGVLYRYSITVHDSLSMKLTFESKDVKIIE